MLCFIRLLVVAVIVTTSMTVMAQSTTPIPLSALTAYSWGSSTVTQDPAGYPSGSALVQSTGGGWQWAGGMSFSGTSNPAVYNALKQAALTSGTLNVRATFSQAFLSGSPVEYLGITTNQNTGTSGWVQTNVGYASTPITTPQTIDFTLPIVASSSLIQPPDFSSNFYVDPDASTISFGFGVNANSSTVGGYVFESMSVSAVPEPGTYALLAGSAIAGVGAFRRRRQLLPPVSC
jgi:hypothetical protein